MTVLSWFRSGTYLAKLSISWALLGDFIIFFNPLYFRNTDHIVANLVHTGPDAQAMFEEILWKKMQVNIWCESTAYLPQTILSENNNEPSTINWETFTTRTYSLRSRHLLQWVYGNLFGVVHPYAINFEFYPIGITLPHQVKTQYMYLHFRLHANYFPLPGKIPEEISRRSMLFHNWRQYLPYQPYVHTTFYHSSGLARNWMFNGSIYCVLYLQFADTAFLLGTAELKNPNQRIFYQTEEPHIHN